MSNPMYQTVKNLNLVSPTYGLIRSDKITDTLAKHGWNLSSFEKVKVRNPERDGYQSHLMRFRHADFMTIKGLSKTNETVLELLAINSHDATRKFRLMLAATRFACANGIILGTSFAELSLVHSERLLKNLDQGVESLVANVPKVIEQVQTMQNKTVDLAAWVDYRERMAKERLKTVGERLVCFNTNYDNPRRLADMESDLFTRFNRVQEAIVRGGITYLAKTPDGQGERWNKTRPLSPVSAVKINKLVYDEALKLVA